MDGIPAGEAVGFVRDNYLERRVLRHTQVHDMAPFCQDAFVWRSRR